MAAIAEEELLLETQKLLNDLNEENNELKRRNTALAQRVREAEEERDAARRAERDLEHDSKHVNFNLMEQVKAKSEDAKAARAAEQQALRQRDDAREQLDRTKEKLADVDARWKVATEQVTLLESKLTDARGESQRAAGDVLRSRDELNALLSSERDQRACEARSHADEASKLKQELAVARKSVDGYEASLARAEEANAEAARLHAQESNQLRQAAQRTLDAEAETAYVHDQMASMATQVYQQLEVYSELTRSALRTVNEHDAAIVKVRQNVVDQKSSLRYLAETDQTLHEVLRRSVDDMCSDASQQRVRFDGAVAEVRTLRAEEKRLQSRVAELERDAELARDAISSLQKDIAMHNADADARRAQAHAAGREHEQLEAAMAALRIQSQEDREAATRARDGLEANLRQARTERAEMMGRIQQLERELHHAQRDAGARDRAAQSDIDELRSENDRLRRELGVHAQSLAAELQRLQHASSHPPSRQASPRRASPSPPVRESMQHAPRGQHGLFSGRAGSAEGGVRPRLDSSNRDAAAQLASSLWSAVRHRGASEPAADGSPTVVQMPE